MANARLSHYNSLTTTGRDSGLLEHAVGATFGAGFIRSPANQECRGKSEIVGKTTLVQREETRWRSTTVLAVRHRGSVVVGADGQVTYGNTIMKSDTKKLRRMLDGRVIVGFAGSTADAFALMERFEQKARDYPGNIARAATELARDWRTDRALRRLEAMMIVADPESTLLLTGQGDVVQPSDGVVGIGSGGPYAAAAARALVRHADLSAADIARHALSIAAEIDVYTNQNLVFEELPCQK